MLVESAQLTLSEASSNPHPRLDPLADVIAWKRANPEAWTAVVRWAHEDRAEGIDPSTRTYCCILRRPQWAHRLGVKRASASVLVNDHISSGLARLLNREYPHLKCPTRDAAADRMAVVA